MERINHITERIPSGDSALYDGERVLPYHDLPRIFLAMERWFSQEGVLAADGIVVEVENSICSALIILFLLERGHGFLVLPKRTDSTEDLKNETLYPSFFRYIVTLSFSANRSMEDIFQPSRFFSITPNREWREPESAIPLSEKLFLKTSGSTGTPKMTQLSHAGLFGNALNTAGRIGLNPADRVFLPVPLFHSYGLTTAFLGSIVAGASIDLQKGANLLRYLKREKEFQPNVAFLTPIFMEGLVKGRRGASHPYRLTISAGDGFRNDLFSRYEALSGPVVNLYGSTEMGAIAAGNPEDSALIRKNFVGKPMPGVFICVKPKNGASIAEEDREAGELWCRHPFGFEGYVDQEGKKIETGPEDPEGWFNLKDLGRVSPEGHVQVLGRSDLSVNRNGSLVFFSDIERAMQTIPGMENAVVIARGEASRGRTLIACCVPTKGEGLDEHAIRKACFSLLPRNAVPDIIRIIKMLPLLPNGKIDRQKLACTMDF